MDYWNNRIIKHEDDDQTWYGVHEVFYDSDGKPEAYTQEPVSVVGDSLDDIKAQLYMMSRDIEKLKSIDAKSIESKANSMHPDAKEIWEEIGESFYKTSASGWSIARLDKHHRDE